MVRPFFVWRDVTAREKKDGNTEFTEIGTQRAQRTARGREIEEKRVITQRRRVRRGREKEGEEGEEKKRVGFRSSEPTLTNQGWGTLKFIWAVTFEGKPRRRRS